MRMNIIIFGESAKGGYEGGSKENGAAAVVGGICSQATKREKLR